MTKNSNNGSNNNNNNNNLICGVNFQNALKSLMTAHSNDLLEIENEFQVQKSNWDQEKRKMNELINKLKFKNQSLKSVLLQYKQQIQGNNISNTSISSTDTTPIRSPNNNVNNNIHPTLLNKTPSNNNNILSPIVNNNKQIPSPTASTTSTTTTSTSSTSSTKKRKKKEIEEKELDELDLPLVQDTIQKQLQDDAEIEQQDEEVKRLNFLDTSINNSQRIMNKYTQTQQTQSPSQIQSQSQQSSPSITQVKKKIKIKEVVRNKEEREKLQGFDCAHCKEFYDAVLGDDETKKKEFLDQCSRHRHSDEPPSTPPGFWNFDFGSPMKKDKSNNNNNTDNNNDNNDNENDENK